MSPPILDPIRGALLRSQPDSKLVALVREGRERAFEEVVRRYRAPLVGFAAMIVPADRADDVVQESLISAYRALPSSDAEINLRPWLFRIVRNRALNDLRDTPVGAELTDELDGVAGPAEEAERHEQLSGLVSGLKALPDAQRQAIVSRELEGRGHAEIAAELGTSPGGVRQLIFRARGALREAAGVLIPLPLLRYALGSSGAEAGAAGATGAGVAALAGGGGAAAGGGAIKLAAIVAATAAAVGGGIAIERDHRGDDDSGSVAAAREVADSGDGSRGPRSAARGHHPESAGPGDGSSDSSGGGNSEQGGEGESGHGGSSGSSGPGDSGSGGSGSSGPGSGDSGSSGSSGSGSSGSGSADSGGQSGSGSSGSDDAPAIETEDPPEVEFDDSGDSSGSGSGSSGSSGSGSSGSGTSGSDSSGSDSSGSGSSGSGSDDELRAE